MRENLLPIVLWSLLRIAVFWSCFGKLSIESFGERTSRRITVISERIRCLKINIRLKVIGMIGFVSPSSNRTKRRRTLIRRTKTCKIFSYFFSLRHQLTLVRVDLTEFVWVGVRAMVRVGLG